MTVETRTWLASTTAKAPITIDGDEEIRVVDDPSGTPVSGKVTIDALKTYISTEINTTYLTEAEAAAAYQPLDADLATLGAGGSGARDFLDLGTSDTPQFTGIELGHATDTTLARVAAGRASVEGKELAFRTVYNVKSPEFGALGDNSTDDTAAFTAAIAAAAAAGGGIVYVPYGTYRVFGALTITAAVVIRGQGSNLTIISQRTTDADTFVFKPTTAGSSSAMLSGARIEGVNVSHASTAGVSTTGAGIRFLQCNGFKLYNCSVNDAAEGIVVQGGQYGSLKTFQSFASSGSALASGSALLHFKEADVGGGSYQPCYTTEIDDFRLSATKLRDSCIRIASADGLQFSNAYVALGENSLLKVAFDRNGATVAAVSFTNTYFDCVSQSTGTPSAIVIPDDAHTSSFCYELNIGSGCFIGNGASYGILCQKPETMLLSASDVRFVNMELGAFVVDNASGDLLDVLIDGCQFQNCGSGATNVVSLTNGRCLSINGNTFADNTNVQVKIAGTWRTGSITGNVNSQSTVADLDYSTATFTSPLVISGNSSRRTTAATSWLGSRVGNVAVTDTNRLDWYEEGTFTPTVLFGGASTGITYTRQIGNYTRIGDRVMFNLRVTISAVGSATGAATIGGFPSFATADANMSGYPCSLRMTAMAGTVGPEMVTADVIGGTAAGSVVSRLYRIVSGTQTALLDTNFSATSDIILSGSYRVA